MRLKRLKLTNWCSHGERDVAFGHFTVVRGPNGSGKTTLLEAVPFALYGDTRMNGVIQTNVRFGSDSLRVQLELEHGGRDVKVVRSVRDGKTTVTLEDGEKLYRGAGPVSERVDELLGFDKRFALDHVFVSQRRIDSFLTGGGPEREEFLLRLFRIDRATTIHANMRAGNVIKVPAEVDATHMQNAVNGYRRELTEAEARVLEIAERLKTFDSVADAIREAETQKAKITDHRIQLERAAARAEEGDRVLADIDAQLASMPAAKVKQKKMMEAIVEATVDARRKFQEAEWQSRQKEDELRRLKEAVLQVPRWLNDAAYDPTRPLTSHYADELSRTEAEIQMLNKMLNVGDGTEMECPLCGSLDSAQLLQNVRKMRRERDEARSKAAAASEEMSKSNASERAMREMMSIAKSLEPIIRRLGDLLTGSDRKGPPDSTEIEAHDAARKWLTVQAAREKVEVKWKSALADAERRRVVWEELKSQTPEKVDEVALAHAKKQHGEWQQLSGEARTLERQLPVMQQRLAAAELSLAQAIESNRNRERIIKVLAVIEETRQLFSREGLPAQAIARGVGQIVRRSNQLLRQFDARFEMVGWDSSGFTVRMPDGFVTNRLSMGQGAMVALSIRLTVHSRIAGDYGLLCLDEPTNGLDRESISRLPSVLSSFRDSAEQTGLQVVLVTHERGFDSLADQVIDLAL